MKSTTAYLKAEQLGAEQWLGAGSTIWQVVDPSKTTLENSQGIVHQAALIPIARKARCRVWSLLHGYGWLPVKGTLR